MSDVTVNVEQKCSNCKYWLSGVLESGQCRRFPPPSLNSGAIYREAEMKGFDEENETALNFGHCIDFWPFPETSFYAWCGEWQPKQ